MRALGTWIRKDEHLYLLITCSKYHSLDSEMPLDL